MFSLRFYISLISILERHVYFLHDSYHYDDGYVFGMGLIEQMCT